LLGKWGRPDNRNQGGYDFIDVRSTEHKAALKFVNTTVAKTHDLKTHLTEELVAAFTLYYVFIGVSFFFVVPENRVGEFKVGSVEAQVDSGLLHQLGWPNNNQGSIVKVAGFRPSFQLRLRLSVCRRH
jgi:hypothetical protein